MVYSLAMFDSISSQVTRQYCKILDQCYSNIYILANITQYESDVEPILYYVYSSILQYLYYNV